MGDVVIKIPPHATDLEEKEQRFRHSSRVHLQHDTTITTSSQSSPDCGLSHMDHSHDEIRGGLKEDSDEEGNTFGWFGSIYDRIKRLHLLARYTIYILPPAIAIAVCIIVLRTVARSAYAGQVRIVGIFIWLETVWLCLWASNLAAKALPAVFRLFSSLLSADTARYSKLLTAVETPITLFIWALVAWGSVPLLYSFPRFGQYVRSGITWNAPGSPWTETARRVLLATVPVAAVYLVEKLIVAWVSINYHETQFATKIAESARWVKMVAELYRSSISIFPEGCKEFQAEDRIILDSLIRNNHGHKTSQFRRKIGRVNAGVASTVNGFIDKILQSTRTEVSPEYTVVQAALGRKSATEALARRLWQSLAQAGAVDLYEEDILRVFGPRRHDEAEAVFLRLDFNRNGAVSLEEIHGMLDDVARQRDSMSKSMTDVKSSIDTFSGILAVAGLVGIALIYAAFFTENFARNFMAITTAILSLSFAFASTVQEFAASFLFLFVQHPFDVGDRVQVGDDVEMIVERISLLHTVFRGVKDNRSLQIPNRISSTLRVTNLSRSRMMVERINVTVNTNTTADEIEQLQTGLHEFVQSPASRRDYRPGVTVNIADIGDFTSLTLVIVYGHKSNWGSESLRLKRRNRFMAEVLTIMRRIPVLPPGGTIKGSGSLEHPQYTVEISAKEAQAALEMSWKRAQGKRQDTAQSEGQNTNVQSPPPESSPMASATTTAIDHIGPGKPSAISQRRSTVRGLRPLDASECDR